MKLKKETNLNVVKGIQAAMMRIVRHKISQIFISDIFPDRTDSKWGCQNIHNPTLFFLSWADLSFDLM